MGQSLNRIDEVLAPYARKSYLKYLEEHVSRLKELGVENYKEVAKQYADEDLRKEIRDGVQTIQYQINTLN